MTAPQPTGAVSPELKPVAWRVKDFADGWILCHTEGHARREAEGAGNLVQPLYISPSPLPPETEAVARKLDAALERIQPLTGFGEDHIWRPANAAWEAMVAARDFLALFPPAQQRAEAAPVEPTHNLIPHDLDLSLSAGSCRGSTAGAAAGDETAQHPAAGYVQDLSEPRPAKATGEWPDVWSRAAEGSEGVE